MSTTQHCYQGRVRQVLLLTLAVALLLTLTAQVHAASS
jgi:hypothetical protein